MPAIDTEHPRAFTEDWARQAAEVVNRGPDATRRAEKLDTYWDWIDAVRSTYTASWAIGLRESGEYLLLSWSGGRCRSGAIVTAEGAHSATYRFSATGSTWRELFDGGDVGRTVMYRGLLLEHGDVLAFFRGIYFFVEALAAICRIPTQPLAPWRSDTA
ncbi:MAG: hypothetical protein ACRDRL_04755 [Sciscionella sp.]